ncbi:MAG: hypothetical protein ACOC2H_07370 [Spirochaetota bacterium]
MEIEDIIKKSIDKLNHDIELRNSLYLNIIHRNIDALVEHSPSWFGDSVPKEFIEILNSLINLSIIFADRARKSSELIFEKSYQEFSPEEIINTIKFDFLEMMTFRHFDVESEPGITIITSRQIFKDSLYHIFFCVSQFITEASRCAVRIYSSNASHIISIQYLDLVRNLPDIRTLLRLFFVYDTKNTRTTGPDMNIRVGLNIAVENIKRIGGIIHIDYAGNSNSGLEIRISFPSKELLDTINDVRKYAFNRPHKYRSGIIIMSFLDKMTELLVSESLQDAGYTIEIESIAKIKLLPFIEAASGIIVDYDNILQNFSSVDEFTDQMQGKRIICIYRKAKPETASNADIRFVAIPFEIDHLLELLD